MNKLPKMKRLSISLIALAAIALTACDGKKKADDNTPPVTIVAVDQLPGLVEAHGTIGEGTSMNVMEFISDKGDTLYLEMNSAQVMGGENVGDEVQVVYNTTDESNVAQIAINLTSLQHLWSQRGADGKEQSLELNANGYASTYDMSVTYDHWEVHDGLLLLHSPKKIGDEKPAPVDTFEIMELTDESLVLMHGVIASEFERTN